MSVNLGTLIDPAASYPDVTGGAIPPRIASRKRFPILFLVDISGSTGDDHGTTGNADIHRINTIIKQTLNTLRYPQSGTDLANQQSSMDISLITYSSGYSVVIPWTLASNLDPNIRPFTPDGGTGTGQAILYSLGYVRHRLETYQKQNIRNGRPMVLHFSDGAPTDMSPGDAAWVKVQQHMKKLVPNSEVTHCDFRHMVTKNGADPILSTVAMNGTSITGLNVLAQLSGARTAYRLDDHPEVIPEMVDFLTHFIGNMTTIFGAAQPDPNDIADDALQNAAHITSYADLNKAA